METQELNKIVEEDARPNILRRKKMIKLNGYSLDKPSRELYAEEVNPNRVVNHEQYYTQGKPFLTRMNQLRSIDGLLRSVGFEKVHHNISLLDELSDLYGAVLGALDLRGYYVGMQTEPYRRYSNRDDHNFGTIVEILPTYGGRYRRCEGLTIDVAKKGAFEDYVWTCNLFRKLFGLKERTIGGNRK